MTTVHEYALALTEPDAADWNAFVANHPTGHMLQMSEWGALKSRFGWDARRIMLVGPDGPRAGAQVLFRRKYGLSVAYVPRGPLLSGHAATDTLLLRAIRTLARRNRAVFIRLEPNLREDDAAADLTNSWLQQHGYTPTEPMQPHSSIHLDVTPEWPALLSAMSKGHRADIKRATREGVQVRIGTTPADLDAFYQIMTDTAARARFGIHSRAYYEHALAQFGDAMRLLLAEREGQTLATAIVGAAGTTALYLYSGSTADGLKYGAQHAIQWEALQWARQRGCTTYDFWGIPDALGRARTADDEAASAALESEARQDPLYGVFRFKKGFGGRIVRYLPAYDHVLLALPYRLWRRQIG